MLEALLPYISVPEVKVIGPIKLHLFGPLVAAGLIVGRSRCLAYARRKNLDEALYSSYLVWMLLVAFCISHWISAFFYYPEKVAQNPWVLLEIWNGLSSVGGFFGAFVGAMIYLRIYCARKPVGRQPVLVYADTSTYGLLIGWCFGRAGCSIVHDHPGRVVPEGTFMAVGPWPDGSWRYDLGLFELFFAIALMVAIYLVVQRRDWPPGRLTGLVLTVYAPFRFFLDSLRTDTASRGVIAIPDERYLGLTPAQWFTFLFLVVGLWLLLRKPSPGDLDYAKDSDRRAREEAEKAEKAERKKTKSDG